ncbi:dihydrodipicolinate synthase family protein [uncultured Microbacterium sp.]|uniref:dihydrodipicolinate synthase family protein n=1 Tax=uncultured Microbacterium sp. TaxID=191216 RepID=UPI0035C9CEEB
MSAEESARAIFSFEGVIPVLETPFTSGGEIDAAGFERVVGHVMEAGAAGVMFPGFASEFAKLSQEERHELALIMIAATHERPGTASIVSVPDHATTLAVAEARWAAEHGADAINLLPPFFMSPSREAITEHLAHVLDAVPDTPVIVQLAPGLTGSAFAAEDLAALASRFANLAAVKVEAVPPGRMVSHFAAMEPALPCLVGYAGLFLPDALARGARGVQPGCSFVELYETLWAHWSHGDLPAFTALHRRMVPYLLEWMQSAELIVQVEKTITVRRGLIDSDVCRTPGYRLDRYEIDSIDRFLAEFADELAPA